MPGFILLLAGKLKLPPWLVAIVSGLLLLASLWGLARCAIDRHDKGVVNAYENGVQAQVANEVAAGTNAADAKDNIAAAQDESRANQLHADIGNAVAAHPVEAHHAAGPASQAALDRLRQRRK